MSSYTFKLHGRNVRFKAASMTLALFARDHHLEHLRKKARERATSRRAVKAQSLDVLIAQANAGEVKRDRHAWF